MAFLCAGPVGASSTHTALGEVTTTAGEGRFSVNETARTEFSQESSRAILDWATDIQQPADHSLEFRQAEGFAVLNRSPGEHPSQFWGRIVCDATCVFANEAGIHFNDGSSLDVGRMIAAGGRISSQNFLSGLYQFTNLAGSVANHGEMRGHSIHLLGQRVANFGHVETSDGSFMMLAGDEVLLRDHDHPIVIHTSLSPGTAANSEPSVENAGTIRAGRGEVRLAAGDMLAFAIRNSGEISGGTVSLEGSDGGSVEVSGRIDAVNAGGGGRGGSIDILGDYVTLRGGAQLDASGENGGGSIRVGGGRGGDSGLRSARGTFVDANAQIRADATGSGDGGSIIVWAEETTQVYGLLSAMGGPLGGSGGFAETSARGWLDVDAAPRLQARSHLDGDHGGEWLIDPNNIRIFRPNSEDPACDPASPACLDSGLSQDQRNNPIFELAGGPVVRPTVDDSELDATLIEETLEQGIGVTISTASVLVDPGTQDGNLIVEAAIAPDDSAASPGSEATLTLRAANNLTVLHDIKVAGASSSSPSNLKLNIQLTAGDLSQAQNPLSAEEIDTHVPNTYRGTLQLGEVDSPVTLNSAGGNVSLEGIHIALNSDSKIDTGGGNLFAFSFAGSIDMAGEIDTSTDLLNDDGNTRVGGNLTINGQAARVPSNGTIDALSDVPDGSGTVILGGKVTTGGGAVESTSTGGNIEVRGLLDTSSDAGTGGIISLLAASTELTPLHDDDGEVITTGGRIDLGSDSDLRSGGGGVSLGLGFEAVQGGAREIFVKGRIDTTQLGSDAAGGRIRLQVQGDEARVEIGNSGGVSGVEILTHGGSFESGGDGGFVLQDTILNTLNTTKPDEGTSRIDIRHAENVDIVGSTLGATLLAAHEIIQIAPAVGQGSGDLSFTGQPELIADAIFLQAGDGVGTLTSPPPTVSLDDAQFHDGQQNAPAEFSLLQDGDLDADDIKFNIGGGDLSTLEKYTLAAWDGVIRIADPASVSDEDLELRLHAGTGLEVSGFFKTEPDMLELLGIEVVNDFILDSELAEAISDAARNLEIAAGSPADPTGASLTIQGGLAATNSILLQAGSDGEGDLVFEANPATGLALRSDEITLWAGNGDSSGDSKIRSASLAGVTFAGHGGGSLSGFTLRQDASIDDTTLPAFGSFTDFTDSAEGLPGLEVLLRSDSLDEGGGNISLGDGGETALAGGATTLAHSALSLHARKEIDLTAQLLVRSLDIGGLADFTYSKALHEKVAFDDDLESRLVLRAGLEETGVLSFEGDLPTIEADEIRLVAGDGEGGNTASTVALSPETGAGPTFKRLSDPALGGNGLEFVFRQDGNITQADLQDLALHFGDDTPSRLAIRSDDGGISFSDGFSDPPLLNATDQLVLSAGAVSLTRRDGQNLVIDEALALDPGADTDALQIRANVVSFQAVYPTPEDPDAEILSPQVLLSEGSASSKLRLSLFDTQTSTDPVPAAFDFSALPTEAPSLIIIEQDADIFSSNLLDPSTQLGAGGNAALGQYWLTSRRGRLRITPESVEGADLRLSLADQNSEDVDDRDPTRSIEFDGDLFELESLVAESPFAWTVKNFGGGSLEITAEKNLQLTSGLIGEGNLDFAGGVSLKGNRVVLTAGNDPLAPTPYFKDALLDARPLIHLRDDLGQATVQFELREREDRTTSLQIRQAGDLTDTLPEPASPGDESLIPDWDQIKVVEADWVTEASLEHIQLESFSGDITLNSLFSAPGVPILPGRNQLFSAGSAVDAENTVHIGQADGGHLDLVSGLFDSFLVLAPRIEFQTTGAGLIKVENDSVILLGPSTLDGQGRPTTSSTGSLLFEQQAAFGESLVGCDNGCLPNPESQLGPTGAFGIQYTILSTGNSILLNDRLAQKVAHSALTLAAFDLNALGEFDPEPDSITDVKIEIDSQRILDLALESMVVRDSFDSSLDEIPVPANLIDIHLRDTDSTATNDLTIASNGNQNYHGHVTIDGRVELTGLGIQIAGMVEGADADSDNDGEIDRDDELVIGVTQLALLDDHVGRNAEGELLGALELLRVNFNPFSSSNPALGLGANHQEESETQIRAGRVEVVTSVDLEKDPLNADGEYDIDTANDSLLASIYKRAGDLRVEADLFTMGMGEKLSVPGQLSIVAQTRATLGDVAALEIDVDSPIITILRRGPGAYINPDGGIHPDGGVDFVANQIYFHNGELEPNVSFSGSGRNPVFGIADPRTTPAWMDRFSIFESRFDGSLLEKADFNPPPPGYFILADLHPEGVSRDDPSSMFIDFEGVPLPVAWNSDPWRPFNRETVAKLAIDLRPLTAREYRSRLSGAALFDDVGEGLRAWDGRPLRVSAARIVGTEAAKAHVLLEDLFGPDNERVDKVRSVLQYALDQYRHNTGARRVVGFELRRYVKNRPSSLYEAYRTLEDLDTLFAIHRGLGLTRGEYRPIQGRWLDFIRPEGITTEELAEAIQPSRYVRGSDVLDIFGD